MDKGDLVQLRGSYCFGVITYKHPTKGVARVFWAEQDAGWESTARLDLIQKANCYKKGLQLNR